MAQISPNPNIVPVGPGGVPGRIFRMIVMLCSGGFLYPNTFVEGMDCTAIDNKSREPDKKVNKTA